MTINKWTPAEQSLADRIEQVLLSTWEPDPMPGPLFHYTDADGFKGIIESGEIWATHFDHLNDRGELRHGEDIVAAEAKELIGEQPENDPRRFFLEQFLEAHPRARLSERTNVYLASLSEAGDLLSQWRAYGSDGSGFAIGFKSLPMPDPKSEKGQAGLTLLRCEYDQNAFRTRSRRILLGTANVFVKFLSEQGDRKATLKVIGETALRACYLRIAMEIPRLKHEAFAEEKEWRLVVIPNPGREDEIVEFRALPNGLSPYVKVPVGVSDKRIDLASIVIGPGQDADRSLRSAKMFLTKLDYDSDNLLRISAAPYRGRGS